MRKKCKVLMHCSVPLLMSMSLQSSVDMSRAVRFQRSLTVRMVCGEPHNTSTHCCKGVLESQSVRRGSTIESVRCSCSLISPSILLKVSSLPLSRSFSSLPLSRSFSSLPLSRSFSSLPLSCSFSSLPLSCSFSSLPLSCSFSSLPQCMRSSLKPSVLLVKILHKGFGDRSWNRGGRELESRHSYSRSCGSSLT